jgi:hypothetical protein
MAGRSPISDGLTPQQTFQQILDGLPRMTAESFISYGGKTGALAQIVSVMLRRREAYRYKSANEIYREMSRI